MPKGVVRLSQNQIYKEGFRHEAVTVLIEALPRSQKSPIVVNAVKTRLD